MRFFGSSRVLIASAGLAVAGLMITACGTTNSSDSGSVDSDSAQSATSADNTGSSAGDADSGDNELTGNSTSDDHASAQLASDTPADDIAAALTGREFESTNTVGFDLAPDATLLVAFTDDGMSIRGSCNTLFGDVEWDGEHLVAPQLASTMMACEAELMSQDTAVANLFANPLTASLDDNTLTLRHGDVLIEFGEVPATDLTDVGTAGVTSSLPVDQ